MTAHFDIEPSFLPPHITSDYGTPWAALCLQLQGATCTCMLQPLLVALGTMPERNALFLAMPLWG